MFTEIGNMQVYVTLVKDIITSVSALIVAILAIIGLHTWKKQLKGKTEYELAQRLLRATYRVREALVLVRNPYQSPAEITQAMKEVGIEGNPLDDPGKKAQTEGALYQNRFRKVQEAFVEIESVALGAEAIWGVIVKEYLKPLQECAVVLSLNIQTYIRELEYTPRRFDEDANTKRFQIIYGWPGDDSNKFSVEINTAVNKMEQFLKPLLIL